GARGGNRLLERSVGAGGAAVAGGIVARRGDEKFGGSSGKDGQHQGKGCRKDATTHSGGSPRNRKNFGLPPDCAVAAGRVARRGSHRKPECAMHGLRRGENGGQTGHRPRPTRDHRHGGARPSRTGGGAYTRLPTARR